MGIKQINKGKTLLTIIGIVSITMFLSFTITYFVEANDGTSKKESILSQLEQLKEENRILNEKIENLHTKIQQNQIQVSTPISYANGGYPRSGTFSSKGKTLVIWVTATAYHNGAGNTMRVDIILNGKIVGFMKAFTNEGSSHKTLNPTTITLRDIPAGEHKIELVLSAGDGSADYNDYSQVMVMELPN